MKTLFPQVLASLIVLLILLILISEERTAPSVSGLRIGGEAASDGRQLMQALLLRHQRQSETANITEAQQLLKENGFYSGPVDGEMDQRTGEALRSFQQSRHLNVTGTVDSATAQELGLSTKPRWTGLAGWIQIDKK